VPATNIISASPLHLPLGVEAQSCCCVDCQKRKRGTASARRTAVLFKLACFALMERVRSFTIQKPLRRQRTQWGTFVLCERHAKPVSAWQSQCCTSWTSRPQVSQLVCVNVCLRVSGLHGCNVPRIFSSATHFFFFSLLCYPLVHCSLSDWGNTRVRCASLVHTEAAKMGRTAGKRTKRVF
jgi:hypothetical protein